MNIFKTIDTVKNANPGILKTLKKIADDHGPELLCLLSGGAIIASGVAAFHASEKIVNIKKRYDKKVQTIKDTAGSINDNGEIEPWDEERLKQELKEARISRDIQYVGACKWVIGLDTIAIAGMIAANKIKGSQIAGLTVALAASEDKIKKLTKTVKEKVGAEEFKAIQDDFRNEVYKGKVQSNNPPFETSDYENNKDAILFFDTYLHSTFYIPKSQVQDAIELAQDYISRNHTLNFNKWRGFLGLDDCPAGANVEWNSLNRFTAKIDSVILDGDEILAIDYGDNMPTSHKI